MSLHPYRPPPPSSTKAVCFCFVFFKVLRLGVDLELQLPAYASAKAMSDLSLVCDHSSQQHWILNPLSETKDQTHVLLDTSWVCYCRATVKLHRVVFCLLYGYSHNMQKFPGQGLTLSLSCYHLLCSCGSVGSSDPLR